MNITFSTLQTISQILILIGVIIGGLGTFGNYYFGKHITEELSDKVALENTINEKKRLQEIIYLGKYHFKYESFLMMKLSEKQITNHDEEALSVIISISHKFNMPNSILDLINKLSSIKNESILINKSTELSRLIFDFLMFNYNKTYAHLYALSVSKDTYKKLKENKFPKTTLDIFEKASKHHAKSLNLSEDIVRNIVSDKINYEDLIEELNINLTNHRSE